MPELRDNIVARVLRPVTEPNAAEDLKEDWRRVSPAWRAGRGVNVGKSAEYRSCQLSLQLLQIQDAWQK